MGIWKRTGTFAVAGMLLCGSSLTVMAEEVEPAGYHVYDVQEGEVSDTWYGIARGDHLRSGISKLKEDSSAGYVLCSGHTFAHRDCDRVYVRIYLDQSDTAASGTWGTIDYWTGEVFEDSLASAASGVYKVDRNQYYRVTGAHSVTEGETTETTMTCTNALFID